MPETVVEQLWKFAHRTGFFEIYQGIFEGPHHLNNTLFGEQHVADVEKVCFKRPTHEFVDFFVFSCYTFLEFQENHKDIEFMDVLQKARA